MGNDDKYLPMNAAKIYEISFVTKDQVIDDPSGCVTISSQTISRDEASKKMGSQKAQVVRITGGEADIFVSYRIDDDNYSDLSSTYSSKINVYRGALDTDGYRSRNLAQINKREQYSYQNLDMTVHDINDKEKYARVWFGPSSEYNKKSCDEPIQLNSSQIAGLILGIFFALLSVALIVHMGHTKKKTGEWPGYVTAVAGAFRRPNSSDSSNELSSTSQPFVQQYEADSEAITPRQQRKRAPPPPSNRRVPAAAAVHHVSPSHRPRPSPKPQRMPPKPVRPRNRNLPKRAGPPRTNFAVGTHVTIVSRNGNRAAKILKRMPNGKYQIQFSNNGARSIVPVSAIRK